MGDVFHIFRRAGVKVILIVVHVLFVILLIRGDNNLNFTAEHRVEAVATGGLLETGNTRSVAPFVQFTTKGISFCLEHAKFTSSNQPVMARSMDVGNRRVDDRRLGRTTNLGEVRQESSEVLEE